MLTADSLTGVEGLTADQINKIADLSKTDQEVVVSTNRKSWWDRIDTDIKEIFGTDKPGGVKTYESLKTVLTDAKTKADGAEGMTVLQTNFDTLKTENDNLKTQIKDGSGESALVATLEQTVKDKEGEIKTLRDTYGADKAKWTKDIDEQKLKASGLHLMHKLDVSESGLKFKDVIPKTLLEEALASRKNAIINSVTQDTIDDGKGGKQDVLRDPNGEILRNPANGLNPFTPAELYLSKIDDLIDTGKNQGGSGSSGGAGGGKSTHLNMNGVNDRVVAVDKIRSHILSVEGIGKLDPKFGPRQQELEAEYKVLELPMPGE